MIRLALTVIATIIANAVGLLLAAFILRPTFVIDPMSFIITLLIFTGVMVLTGPLVTKIAITSMPQIRGAIALVTAFIGLKVTDWLTTGMDIGGVSNWLAATLLVWLGSLLAEILLPIYVFKQLRDNGTPNIRVQ
ncbi:MAG: hypothetical protein NTX73_05335 [Rhodobacterales bacterium]|nr:hypothetical protein [Rhodobacterales bacterium]